MRMTVSPILTTHTAPIRSPSSKESIDSRVQASRNRPAPSRFRSDEECAALPTYYLFGAIRVGGNR